MPISGIAGSYGCFTSSFLKNLPAVFHSGCICLYSHKQCKRIQFSLHPFQHLVFVDFFDDGPDDWCEVIPDGNFDMVSLIMSDVEHLLMCLLFICISSWRNICLGLLLTF